MKNRVGNITIPGDAEVWPHEQRTAAALARAGHGVEFIKKSNKNREKTPDVLINGERWEMKAPKHRVLAPSSATSAAPSNNLRALCLTAVA